MQSVHCTDSMTYCGRKPAKDPHIQYSTALAKLALDRCALSVAASLILVNLGGGFVCLAAGQRSLLHSVSKAVIPTCEGKGGTWVSASQRLGTGRHSLCTWRDR